MADEKKMDDEELQRLVGGMIDESIAYDEDDLAPERARATDYYHGEPFGNEEDGRSQFILTEVRDTVRGMLPSVCRVIFGSERVVEFAPTHAGSAEQAEQASDYIQHAFAEQNPGFMTTLSVLNDGFIRKLGVFKLGWDETAHVTNHVLEDLTLDQIAALAEEPGVELTRIIETGAAPVQPPPGLVGPDGQPLSQPAEPVMLHKVEFTHGEPDGRLRFWSVPPEEFIINREARDIESALFVGHRQRLTKSELLALGIDEKVIEEHGGDDESTRDSEEAAARRPDGATGEDPEAGEANEKHLFVEGYARIDFDGDGFRELRKVCTIGVGHHIVENVPVRFAPFSAFSPIPEPHTLVGQSIADVTMDLQYAKSMLARATFDSLAASIFPRTSFVEGKVNITDILNTEIGAPIRTTEPGMIQTHELPFVGQHALPFMQWFNEVAESRTGQRKGTQGLDADALQSTTSQGVNAAIVSSQEQTELIVRVFAEGTLKPLFRMALLMLVEKKPRARMVRLRGKFVEIDPRTWDAEMDVEVKVALGSSFKEQKVATLAALKETMENVFQLIGVENPLFTLGQYSYVIRRVLELQGERDTTKYINDVPADWKPPAPPEPQPTPEQVLAATQLQVEQMKAQKDIALKTEELKLKQLVADREHERLIEQMRVDAELRKLEIELKYKFQGSTAAVDAALRQVEIENKAATESRKIDHQEAVAEHNQMLAQERHDTELELERKAAEREAKQGPAE